MAGGIRVLAYVHLAFIKSYLLPSSSSRYTDGCQVLVATQSSVSGMQQVVNMSYPRHISKEGYTRFVLSVASSLDGKQIMSGSSDNPIRLWDAADSGQPIGSPLKGHIDAVTSVAFSLDGRWIVSPSNDMGCSEWYTH